MSKQLMPFFMQTIKLTSMTINQCQFCGPFLPNLKMKNQLENFIPLLFICNSCFLLHSPFYSMLFLTFNLNFLGKYYLSTQVHSTAACNKMQIKKKTLEIYRSKSAVVGVESWKNKAIKAEFIIWIQIKCYFILL